MNDREMTATKTQIDTATDTDTLIGWYDHAEDMATNILATIEARDLADLNEDEWFYRASDKYAHCKVAMKRVLRRLDRIGFDGVCGPDDRLRDRVLALELQAMGGERD